MAVLAEMVEAAEDPHALLRDLRFMAVGWAAGLSCYLHGAQNGVAIAALGAVAVYRLEAIGGIVMPNLLDVWKYALDPRSSGCCAESHVSLERKEKVAKCVAESVEEPDAMSDKLLETLRCLKEKPDEPDAVSEVLLKAVKSSAKKIEGSNSESGELLNEGKTKQWKKLHGLEMALLSLTEAVLKFCQSLAWLYLSILLMYFSILLLLGKK